MRHRVQGRKLGLPSDQRVSLLHNQVRQLFEHGEIKTTETRAKEVRRIAERLITTAKRDDLHARRMTRYPGLWVVEFSAIGLVLAIVWNMTVKAGTGSAIAAAVIGYGVGAGFGFLFTRAPSPETQAAASPSGS